MLPGFVILALEMTHLQVDALSPLILHLWNPGSGLADKRHFEYFIGPLRSMAENRGSLTAANERCMFGRRPVLRRAPSPLVLCHSSSQSPSLLDREHPIDSRQNSGSGFLIFIRTCERRNANPFSALPVSLSPLLES
jgi:hypothetical protein